MSRHILRFHIQSRIDRAFFVLDPVRLNSAVFANHIPKLPDSKFLDYEHDFLARPNERFTTPLAVRSEFRNERIQRQRGCFTIHGCDERPLEFLTDTCVEKIILDDDAVSDIRKYLDRANLNAFSLFPDFTGLGQFLSAEVALQQPAYDAAIGRLISEAVFNDAPIQDEEEEKRYVSRDSKSEELRTWRDDINAPPFLVVKGKAGIGKTTLLAEGLASDKLRPAIFLSPKRLKGLWKSAESEQLDDVLVTYVSGLLVDSNIEQDTLRHNVLGMIRSGDLVLVVDGIDEIARTTDLDTTRALITDLSDVLGAGTKARIAFACRDHILEHLELEAKLTNRNSKKLSANDKNESEP